MPALDWAECNRGSQSSWSTLTNLMAFSLEIQAKVFMSGEVFGKCSGGKSSLKAEKKQRKDIKHMV